MSNFFGPVSDGFAFASFMFCLVGTIAVLGDKDIVTGSFILALGGVFALLSISYSIKESK